MSKDINVKIEHASLDVMKIGAEALKMKKGSKENQYVLPTGRTIELGEGRVDGNFWQMGGQKLGDYTIKTSSEEDNAAEVTGAIRRAGLTEMVATHLINDSFETNRDVSTGSIRATRRDEVIEIEVGLDGLMASKLGGFEGDACSLTMQKLLDKLPQHSVESETLKTQPQHVVRTQG